MDTTLTIRKAERQDVPLLLEFIKGIARYEKMENDVIASPEMLEREMFVRWGLPSTSTTSQHSSDTLGCIWKTCSYGQKIVARASGRHYCCIWLRLHGSTIAEEWNGRA